MVDKLHNDIPPDCFTKHRGVDSNEFSMEAKYCISIKCARVIPSTHDIKMTLDCAHIVVALSDGFQVNIGQLLMDQIAEEAQ